MKIHADLTQRAVVNSHILPWVKSPMPGVERRMLERDGDEVARATSIVRYARDSYFEAHSHAKGEEFLVLEGTFSDETGDFNTGMYVRNPPGSRHQPYTKNGCTILVKLRQFDPQDKSFVRIDTHQATWHDRAVKGIASMPLHKFEHEEVQLLRWQPGAQLKTTTGSGGKEIYVIAGSFSDDLGSYPAGTWIRYPANQQYTFVSPEGCTLYQKTGHLEAV